ncbi:MAG TPA: winged helix-turn-helix domain-containing protein [Caulobacteraceae bacterium]
MARAGAAQKSFVLGAWRIDPGAGSLAPRVGGEAIRLEPRQMDLLLLLAGSGGRVVSKDEIVAQVWGGRAIGDDTLASAVSKLRKVLGATKTDKYIETLSKRGYRLVATVGEGAPADAAASIHAPTNGARTAETSKAEALIAHGLAALKVPLPASLAEARLYFDGAIEADPTSAVAQAGLAEVYLTQSFAGVAPASVLMPAAKGAARAATALDPTLSQGFATLGAALLIGDRDFTGADEALARAVGLDPANAYAQRIRAFAFMSVGRFAEAERAARTAADLEPFSLIGRSVLLRVLTLARRWRAVVAEARSVLDRAPQSPEAWSAKGWAHQWLGEEREAIAAFLESLKAWSVGDDDLARLMRARADGGFEAFAAATADLFERQSMVFRPRPLDIAMLRAAAGQTDQAFAMLELAADRDDPFLLALPWLPHLDRLRNDHRFNALVERVRLVR